MIALWPELKPRPLPRPVVPFQLETVDSFIARLAHANHVAWRDLRAYLAGPYQRYPRAEWLADVSGQPRPVLEGRLRGLSPLDRDPTRQRAHARPMCRLCSARRGVTEPVYCWLPNHITVCRRHQRWVGPSARSWDQQRCLVQRPQVVDAAKHHQRLVRRHTEEALDFAIKDARRVLLQWPRHRALIEVIGASKARQNGLDIHRVDPHINSYPDLVRLAGLMSDHRPVLQRTAFDDADTHDAATNAFLNLATNVFDLQWAEVEWQALMAWVGDQRLIARKGRHDHIPCQ